MHLENNVTYTLYFYIRFVTFSIWLRWQKGKTNNKIKMAKEKIIHIAYLVVEETW